MYFILFIKLFEYKAWRPIILNTVEVREGHILLHFRGMTHITQENGACFLFARFLWLNMNMYAEGFFVVTWFRLRHLIHDVRVFRTAALFGLDTFCPSVSPVIIYQLFLFSFWPVQLSKRVWKIPELGVKWHQWSLLNSITLRNTIQAYF